MKSIETIKDKQFLTILNEKGKRKEERGQAKILYLPGKLKKLRR